jgi:hypothetical protein
VLICPLFLNQALLKPADFSPNEAGSISGMIGILEGKIGNEGFKS